ncbi:Centromere protein Scm3, N-terminal [Phaffia rhodozyma]|uniref:Centromere protein Scm3, N-terminal n=1 Tax=Phaffia rhodozyma TaxID=264483 RepID=A0A0F7SRK0_PHARH|nr:Centromere protein Scm3, N-terminal [Phaffia rhodozyma]
MSYPLHSCPYPLYARDRTTTAISLGSTPRYSSPSRPRYATSPRYAFSPQHTISSRVTANRLARPRYQSRVISDISSDLRDEDCSDTASSSTSETESEIVQLSTIAKGKRRALVPVRPTSRRSPIVIDSSSSSSPGESSPLPCRSPVPSVSPSKSPAAFKRKRVSSSSSPSSSSSSIIIIPSTTLPVSSRKPSYQSSLLDTCSSPPIPSVDSSISLPGRCRYELSEPRYARHKPLSDLAGTSKSLSFRREPVSPTTRPRYGRTIEGSTRTLLSFPTRDGPSTPCTSRMSRRSSIGIFSSSPAARATDEVERMLDETADLSVDGQGELTPRRSRTFYERTSSQTIPSPIPASVISAFTSTYRDHPRRLIRIEPMFKRLFTRLVSEAPPSSSDQEEGDADTSESLNVDEEEEYDPLSEFPPEDSQPPTPSTLARFLKPQVAFQPPPLVRRPYKRRRSRWGDSSLGSDPSSSNTPREQALTDEDLASKRYNASLRLLDSWEEIVNKYKGIPMEEDDEIDLLTGELVNDRGRLRASLGDVGLEGFLRDLVAESEGEEGEEEKGLRDDVDIGNDDKGERSGQRREQQREEEPVTIEGFFGGFRKPDDGRRSRLDPDDLKSFMEEEKAMSGNASLALPVSTMTVPTATVAAA